MRMKTAMSNPLEDTAVPPLDLMMKETDSLQSFSIGERTLVVTGTIPTGNHNLPWTVSGGTCEVDDRSDVTCWGGGVVMMRYLPEAEVVRWTKKKSSFKQKEVKKYLGGQIQVELSPKNISTIHLRHLASLLDIEVPSSRAAAEEHCENIWKQRLSAISLLLYAAGLDESFADFPSFEACHPNEFNLSGRSLETFVEEVLSQVVTQKGRWFNKLNFLSSHDDAKAVEAAMEDISNSRHPGCYHPDWTSILDISRLETIANSIERILYDQQCDLMKSWRRKQYAEATKYFSRLDIAPEVISNVIEAGNLDVCDEQSYTLPREMESM
eukprot:GHVN01017093.1.p1 GENE.GHVN01017093.1~~GHVN01017093.1.p1  ORF type:complete len:325 (-),score=40.74 GHVN01017093.1:531-1505(-)